MQTLNAAKPSSSSSRQLVQSWNTNCNNHKQKSKLLSAINYTHIQWPGKSRISQASWEIKKVMICGCDQMNNKQYSAWINIQLLSCHTACLSLQRTHSVACNTRLCYSDPTPWFERSWKLTFSLFKNPFNVKLSLISAHQLKLSWQLCGCLHIY